jgi:hypothetical protein
MSGPHLYDSSKVSPSHVRPDGIVFVSYARRNLDRAKPLVDELAK